MALAATVIDAICGNLFDLNHPKLRLSCRNEEWYHGNDLNSLKDVAGDENIVVLQMQPLNEGDIKEIAASKISNPDNFLQKVDDRDLGQILGNPQSLEMYLQIYKDDGGWPKNKSDLMKKSVLSLLKEYNDNHIRSSREGYYEQDMVNAAEDLSAIITLSNIDGIALSRAVETELFPSIAQIPSLDFEITKITASSRLFPSEGAQKIKLPHKIIGDYLTAKSLHRRIKDGSLSLDRALSPLIGHDGVPLSNFRDVYAWLIALLSLNKAKTMVKKDPFGSIIYGDVNLWPDDLCLYALTCLSEFAKNIDPHFRVVWQNTPNFKHLIREKLVPDFRKIIDNETNPHVLSIIFSAIELGPIFSCLGENLLSFIENRNGKDLIWVKDNALRAFCRCCPNDKKTLRKLLDDIYNEKIQDDNDMQLYLLEQLYPNHMTAEEIIKYLKSTDISYSIDNLICKTIVELTPRDDLPILMAAVKKYHNIIAKIASDGRQSLYGNLLNRIFNELADQASIAEIYSWLDICLVRNEDLILNQNYLGYIRNYILERPKLYIGLFDHWIEIIKPKKATKQFYHERHGIFIQLTANIYPPTEFIKHLLCKSNLEKSEVKREFMFSLAFKYACGDHENNNDINIELFYNFVKNNPKFKKCWDCIKSEEISASSMNNSKKVKDREAMGKAKNIENLNILTNQIDSLKNGSSLHNLNSGAKKYINQNIFDSTDCTVFEYLQHEFGDDIANAMLDGFLSLLKINEPISVIDIATVYSNGKEYYIEACPVLIGAEILYKKSPSKLLQLPKCNLETVIAYWIICNHTLPMEKAYEAIIKSQPELTAGILAIIWRKKLEFGELEILPRLNSNMDGNILTTIVASEAIKLLSEKPNLPNDILEALFGMIVRHGDINALQSISVAALANNSASELNKAQWMSIAMIFEPALFAKKLKKIITNENNIFAVYKIFDSAIVNKDRLPFPEKFIFEVIALLGSFFTNNDDINSGITGRNSDANIVRSIRSMIENLANYQSDITAELFDKLIANNSLIEWRDDIRHIQNIQITISRQGRYKAPTAITICELLSNGAPINMQDFQALTIDRLQDLAEDIRGGNDNKWKQFWRLPKGKKLGEPKIENDCRDALLGWFRPIMKKSSITIEPEAAAAVQKRVDIRLTKFDVGTLPIEVKLDNSRDLWTAMDDQLVVKYTNDLKTDGYGIYLVFWFGDKGIGCKSPPKDFGISKPKTARELESIAPSNKIRICVIGVRKPHV